MFLRCLYTADAFQMKCSLTYILQTYVSYLGSNQRQRLVLQNPSKSPQSTGLMECWMCCYFTVFLFPFPHTAKHWAQYCWLHVHNHFPHQQLCASIWSSVTTMFINRVLSSCRPDWINPFMFRLYVHVYWYVLIIFFCSQTSTINAGFHFIPCSQYHYTHSKYSHSRTCLSSQSKFLRCSYSCLSMWSEQPVDNCDG